MTTKIAVIYYSATGNVHTLATALAEGAEKADAEVRLRRVPELAPDSAIDSNPAWRAHLDSVGDVDTATLEPLCTKPTPDPKRTRHLTPKHTRDHKPHPPPMPSAYQ